ncbi:MAG: hypothetical protein AAF253_09425 [Pseudomonadota bacterium]
MAFSLAMLSEPLLRRLFAVCPLWLWPVLAFSLVALRERVQRLEAQGATGITIRLSRWGQAYVAHAHLPGDPPDWKDTLYRQAMGDPVRASEWRPTPLGICSDDASADWAAGTGWYSLVGRDEIPPSALPTGTTARVTTTAGAIASRPARPIRPP